jgi:hypothetical protein
MGARQAEHLVTCRAKLASCIGFLLSACTSCWRLQATPLQCHVLKYIGSSTRRRARGVLGLLVQPVRRQGVTPGCEHLCACRRPPSAATMLFSSMQAAYTSGPSRSSNPSCSNSTCRCVPPPVRFTADPCWRSPTLAYHVLAHLSSLVQAQSPVLDPTLSSPLQPCSSLAGSTVSAFTNGLDAAASPQHPNCTPPPGMLPHPLRACTSLVSPLLIAAALTGSPACRVELWLRGPPGRQLHQRGQPPIQQRRRASRGGHAGRDAPLPGAWVVCAPHPLTHHMHAGMLHGRPYSSWSLCLLLYMATDW